MSDRSVVHGDGGESMASALERELKPIDAMEALERLGLARREPEPKFRIFDVIPKAGGASQRFSALDHCWFEFGSARAGRGAVSLARAALEMPSEEAAARWLVGNCRQAAEAAAGWEALRIDLASEGATDIDSGEAQGRRRGGPLGFQGLPRASGDERMSGQKEKKTGDRHDGASPREEG